MTTAGVWFAILKVGGLPVGDVVFGGRAQEGQPVLYPAMREVG